MFEHTGNKIFTDFSFVRKEIEDETDRVTGSNKVRFFLPAFVSICR